MTRIISFLLIAALTGCTSVTSFNSLPKSEDEFRLEKVKLVEKYPDISTYEKKWRGWSPQFPAEQALKNELGEPDLIKKDWFSPIFGIGVLVAINASPFVWAISLGLLPPYPPKDYYYMRGNYCVKAHISRTFEDGYRERMTSWEWRERAISCKP